MKALKCFSLYLMVFYTSVLSAQNASELQTLGESAYNQGDSKKAIDYFNKAINADSTMVWSFFYRGLSYMQQKQFQSAITDFDKVLMIDPNITEIYQYRGTAYSQGIDFNKAVSDFTAAIQFNPDIPSLYNNRGWCHLKIRKYEKAIEDCSKAIELDSSYVLANANRGWAYYQLGKYQNALTDLEVGMRIDPKSSHRATILDHYTKAAVAVESGLTMAPNALHSLKNPGKYFALIIGNNEYKDKSLVNLDQPIKDADNLYRLLTTKYTFDKENVILLKNATRGNIIEALDDLNERLSETDNLLIFYAGHGIWDDDRKTGYWLPVDASKDKTTNWLRNSTIQGYIADIPAQHTLLIADACFGGGIFKTRRAFEDAPSSIENLYKLSSRKGMTSGMLNEVPDRSVFMEYLVRRLEQNEEKYITSLKLFTQFREAVMNNSNNTPQYGTIHNTGDEGGDFILVIR